MMVCSVHATSKDSSSALILAGCCSDLLENTMTLVNFNSYLTLWSVLVIQIIKFALVFDAGLHGMFVDAF